MRIRSNYQFGMTMNGRMQVKSILESYIRYNMENNNFYERKYFIENKELENKKVILRLDWNVPILDNKIQDYFRIKSTMKTIDYIMSKNPYSLLIVSHLGRPKGYDEKYSFKNIMIKYLIYLKKK